MRGGLHPFIYNELFSSLVDVRSPTPHQLKKNAMKHMIFFNLNISLLLLLKENIINYVVVENNRII